MVMISETPGFGIWIVGFFILGFLGTKDPAYKFFGFLPGAPIAQLLSVYYFLFFLTMPIWSSLDRCKPEPDRVTMK